MKAPEEVKRGLRICTREIKCDGCQYAINGDCRNGMIEDALAYIEQLEVTISLMIIQMQGDCGTCKHRDDERVIADGQLGCRLSPACYECLSKGGRSQWEYEGLPEVKSHDIPV